MAVQAFKFYNSFKEHMANGNVNLDTDTFDMHLYQSASNFATATLSALTSLTSEVATVLGYTLSGKAMTTTWIVGASAGERRFDATAMIWTATSVDIVNVKGAVMVCRSGASGRDPANKLCTYASLTSTQFTVTTGNTLTLTPPAGGIFELN